MGLIRNSRSSAVGTDGIATGVSSISMDKEISKEFIDFMNDNPTVYHGTHAFAGMLKAQRFERLREADQWDLKRGGKYYVERNDSSIVAFIVGDEYQSGNGFICVGGHGDALTLRLKPNSSLPQSSLYLQVGVAPYAGGGNITWLDRDLGLAGRVLVKTKDGYEKRLVRLPYAVGKIPTLAPHFGLDTSKFDRETQINPIIGQAKDNEADKEKLHPPQLTRAIARELNVDQNDIVNWDLEFFDIQPAQYLGLDGEFISVPRCDDKLCSWSAIKALSTASTSGGIIKIAAVFDNEEIGSLTFQGADSNFLPVTTARILESLGTKSRQDLATCTASSLLISSDVTFAFDPNWPQAYEQHQRPELNVGPVISYDPNGHTTSDLISGAICQLVAKRHDMKLQTFQIRNTVRSGGTIGPMLSAKIGVRAAEIGLAQLSMHSVRATTGAKEPELGVKYYGAFFETFERLQRELSVG